MRRRAIASRPEASRDHEFSVKTRAACEIRRTSDEPYLAVILFRIFRRKM
jgi:hypothetical protein